MLIRFLIYFDSLNKNKTIVDIIVLSEIWILNDRIAHLKISNYTFFFNCNENCRLGGTAIYVSDSI